MSRTIAIVEAEIDDVRAAISAVIKGGQSYTINSGGSIRTVTMADTKFLRGWLIELQQELAELEQSADTQGFIVGANW
jgi:hypothetical protein